MEDPNKPQDSTEEISFLVRGMRYGSVATQFSVTLLVLGYGGFKLDEKMGWSPWGSLVGIFLGLGIGVWSMLRQIEKLDRMK
jgi:F0F1-type ATP synthase assembly protein I